MVRSLLLLAAALPLAALEQPNLILPNDRFLPIGDRWSVEGGAGVARADGAAASWRNPAGLGGLQTNEVMAAASIFQYSRSGADSFFGGGDDRRVAIVPGSAGTASTIPSPVGGDDRWGFGLLVATPIQWRSAITQQHAETTSTGSVVTSESYNVDYTMIEPTVGIGRTVGRDLRFGMGGALQIHQLATSGSRSVSDQGRQTSSIETSQITGFCLLARIDAGFQWHDSETGWAMAAMVSSPGVRLWSSGSRTDTELRSDVPNDVTSTAYGNSASYPLRLRTPPRISVALARSGEHFEGEADVTVAYGGDKYDAFPGFKLQSLTTQGGTTTTGVLPIAATEDRRRAVTNLSLGGAWHFSAPWRVHVGFQSDLSPVEDSKLFSQVNLWSIGTGCSYQGEHTMTTVGVLYAWSTAGSATTAIDLPGRDNLGSDLLYRSLNLVVGSSYRF